VHQQVAAMLGALRQTQRAAANEQNKKKVNN
jgi:hypothetical protein